ncbi:MAG: serine hydrolase domain-containing protein [Bauldia sp.]
MADAAQATATGLAKLAACRGGGVAIATLGRIETAEAFAGTVAVGSGPAFEPDSHSLFGVGPLTRTFTGLLFAEAVSSGLVKADDPVSKYLPREVSVPSFFEKGQAVPIRLVDLATHTSGLPRGVGATKPSYGVGQMYADLAKITLTRRPGTKWDESDLGFALLAEAMANVFKLPFDRLLAEKIGTSLGMSETRSADNTGVVMGLGANGQKLTVENPAMPAFQGALGARSTLADMQAFLAVVMAASRTPAQRLLLDWHTFPRTAGGGTVEQGVAWQRLMPFGNAVDVIWAGGEASGFSTTVAFSEKLGEGVVVMASRASCDTQRAAFCLIKAAGDAVSAKAVRGPSCQF